MRPPGVDDAELLRARLTLLALRGGVPREVVIRPDVVRIPPADRLLGTDDAAVSLGLLTKPLAFYSEVIEGVLNVVRWRVPVRAVKGGADRPSTQQRRERYGPDYRDGSVLCRGRDGESLRISWADFETWEFEYPWLIPSGYAIKELDTSITPAADKSHSDSEQTLEVMDFSGGASQDPLPGRIFVERLAADRPMCERCRERRAEFVIRWFEEPQPPRELCQRCIDEELTTEQFDRARSHEQWRAELADAERTLSADELSELAHKQAAWWAYATIPPYVREFIARHRRY